MTITRRDIRIRAAAPELLDALKAVTTALQMAIRSNLSRDLYDSDEEYAKAVDANVSVSIGLAAIAKVDGQS